VKKTSLDKQDLTVEISFLQGLRLAMPHDSELLKILGDDYTKAGRFEEGLEIDLELARLLPYDSVVFYNLACSYSILKKLKESAETLIKAIKLGYTDFDWLQKDSDLKNLRDSSEYDLIRPFLNKRTKNPV
jgi:tetratricopeptide (TPR) repeat protein